jgi:hypothetical protein
LNSVPLTSPKIRQITVAWKSVAITRARPGRVSREP